MSESKLKVTEVRRGLFYIVGNISEIIRKEGSTTFELIGSRRGNHYELTSVVHSCDDARFYTLLLKRASTYTSESAMLLPSTNDHQKPPLHVWLSCKNDPVTKMVLEKQTGTWILRLETDRVLMDVSTVFTTLSLDFGTQTAGESIIMDGLARMFHQQVDCDVQFVFHRQTIGAHVNILRAGSPVFAAMFQPGRFSESTTREVAIKDIEPDVFRELLTYLYTGKAPALQLKIAAQPLYEAADRFGVEPLKDECVHVIVTGLVMDNVVDVLIWSEMHGVARLYEAALDFIALNEKICFQSEWEELSKIYPELCLAAMRRIASRLSSTVRVVNAGVNELKRKFSHI